MEAKFQATNPENIEFSLTMTLPLSEWQAIKDQLMLDYKWPCNKLTGAITSMVIQAQTAFYPEKERGENE